MAPRTVYASLQDGLQPFSLWDQSLADMGSLGVTPCMAAGANSVVLTPIAGVFPPNVTIPQALQAFSFVAVGNSTGPITIQVGTIPASKLYRMDGVTQATTGDLNVTVLYLIGYNAALNSGAGGFQILAPVSNEINPIISGATISGSTITTSTYNGNTWTAGTGILTIAALKTLTVSNMLTLVGTDGTTMTFPSTSATIARTDAANTFTGTQTIGALVATTLNGNTFTAGSYTLTGTAAKTLTFNNSLTLAGTDATTITFQGTDTYVGRATADTLTNKTFDTAGTGNSFKINGTAITANTGTGSNVLATTPTLSQANLVGTTTNDSAAAGSIAEYVESNIATGSAVSLTSAANKTITSISLTAGDWEVSGNISFNAAGSASLTVVEASISLTTNVVDQTAGRNSQISQSANVPGVTPSHSLPVGPVRFSLSTTTSIFLVANSVFTVGTLAGFGIIRARRAR